jgi:hypothetical protein
MLSKAGEIRRDEGCIDYAGQFIMIYPCHGMKGNQEWVYGEVCISSILDVCRLYPQKVDKSFLVLFSP